MRRTVPPDQPDQAPLKLRRSAGALALAERTLRMFEGSTMISRRRLLALASGAVSLRPLQRSGASDAHLSVTPKAPRLKTSPGEHALGLDAGSGRDGLLIVPAAYRPDSPAPLAVILHGAGGSARRVTSLFSVADELGVIVLAPESQGRDLGRHSRQLRTRHRLPESSARPSRSNAVPSTAAVSRLVASPTAHRMACPSASRTVTCSRTSWPARRVLPSRARSAAGRASSCPTGRPTRSSPSRRPAGASSRSSRKLAMR